MAMYYQGGSSEIQTDNFPMLHVKNPNFEMYSDGFLNSGQQFVGVPLYPNYPLSVLAGQQEQIDTQIQRFNYNSLTSVSESENGNQPNTPLQTSRGLSLTLSPHQRVINKRLMSDHQDFSLVNLMMQEEIMGFKYLKAAQQVLNEVASVGKCVINGDWSKDKAKVIKEYTTGVNAGAASGGGVELTTAQRGEIQMRKAKLDSMLDEVEQRYRKYNQEMQILVASFEQAAGIGSAKAYTHLALKTISRQFRCLKDSISTQIKALSKSLGEEETLGAKVKGSRLKFVDHYLRQQRAVNPMVMVQNSAWRPQRGLPERAVSVLRAWLFEHFLHPYPKDSDKRMMAKQTGLTRSQVSNWFINARVRLWKPMVEEMYLEEMKNQENMTTPHKDLATKFAEDSSKTSLNDQVNSLKSKPTKQISGQIITNPSPTCLPAQATFAKLISSLNTENPPEKNPKKPRSSPQGNSPSLNLSVEVTPGDTGKRSLISNMKFNTENYSSTGFLDQFAANFHGNNVSLTLALPPCDQSSTGLTLQQNFISNPNFEFGTRIHESGAVENSRVVSGLELDASNANMGYEMIDFQKIYA